MTFIGSTSTNSSMAGAIYAAAEAGKPFYPAVQQNFQEGNNSKNAVFLGGVAEPAGTFLTQTHILYTLLLNIYFFHRP